MEDVLRVKKIKDCEELATIDAHGDSEIASGWFTCLEEVFPEEQEVKIFGERAKLIGFDLFGNTVVAVCKKGKFKEKMLLGSIKLINSTKAQKLWIQSYQKYYEFL